jgi:hypothetical protein
MPRELNTMTLSRRMARLVVWLVAGATVAGGATALAQASQHAAVLPSAQGLTFPELSGVWCAGPSKCLAVGDATGTKGQFVPISMKWNGQDWSYLTTPATGQFFQALTCTSWTHCMAVGYPGLAEEWNGTSWRVLRTPYPTNLLSVACPSATNCVAVGLSDSAKGVTAIAWNGQKWRATKVPWPAGVMSPELSSVACPSVGYCVTVGVHEHNSFDRPIAFTWNGAHWRRAPALPVKAFVIACPRSRLCVAIGSVKSLLWNRRSWRPIKMPLFNTPEGIACPDRSFCMADDPQFTQVWNGTSWSRIRSALNDTDALWCGSPADCMAVGGGDESASASASQWNGHSWRKLPFA